METAGKFVDDDTLRDALKENGIGRPSTRAAIIETLFKRRYIRRERKRILATPTGVELIGLIHEELLKSAELTGRWEKKLREIERGTYEAQDFMTELKAMVTDIVNAVRNDHTNRYITITTEEDLKKKTPRKKKTTSKEEVKESSPAEKNTTDKAEIVSPTSSENQYNTPSQYVAGFRPKVNPAQHTSSQPSQHPANPSTQNQDEWIGLPCPKCKQGHIIKGKTAYGCSRWKEGCDWRMPFE